MDGTKITCRLPTDKGFEHPFKIYPVKLLLSEIDSLLLLEFAAIK